MLMVDLRTRTILGYNTCQQAIPLGAAVLQSQQREKNGGAYKLLLTGFCQTDRHRQQHAPQAVVHIKIGMGQPLGKEDGEQHHGANGGDRFDG